VLTPEETERLVAAVADPDPTYARLRTNDRYRALVFMGCWLGPRWNEAIGLRVCDINPLRKELTFGRSVVNQNGTTTFTEAMSKTDDSRTVPVPQPVMDALIEHLQRFRPSAGREDFVFLSNRDKHPLRGLLARRAREIGHARRAHRTPRHLADLRHTAASLMFNAGPTWFEVQQRLGHRSPTLTATVSTHLMRERFEEGREKLEGYMAANRFRGPSGDRGRPPAAISVDVCDRSACIRCGNIRPGQGDDHVRPCSSTTVTFPRFL
jgi:integrase